MFKMIKTAYAQTVEKVETATKESVSRGKKIGKVIWYTYIIGISILVATTAVVIAATNSLPQVVYAITNQDLVADTMHDFGATRTIWINQDRSLDQNQSK